MDRAQKGSINLYVADVIWPSKENGFISFMICVTPNLYIFLFFIEAEFSESKTNKTKIKN